MQQGRSPWSDPAYAPPPAPRRGPTLLIVGAVVGGLLAMAALTVVTVVALASAEDPKPKRPVSTRFTEPPPVAATGPEFTRLDNLCAMLPKDLFKRLVPGATPKYGRDYAGWACTLSAQRRGDGVIADRRASVVVDLLKADTTANDTGRAKAKYASERHPDTRLTESLEAINGRDGPPHDLTGLGDQAFATYRVNEKKIVGTGGTATVRVRLHNAFIKIEYGGKDTPYKESDPMYEFRSKPEPVSESKAREAAESLARATVKALGSCRTCGA